MPELILNQVGDWNKIPASIVPEFPADGTVITYRFLNSTTDPITKRTIWPSLYQIPAKSKLNDPTKPGKFINVGMIGSVDRDGKPIDEEILRHNIFPNQSRGMIRFVAGSSPEVNQIIAYLPHADCNASNPNRNTKVEAVLELVDYDAAATKSRNERAQRREAAKTAESFTAPQVERAALILGYDTNTTEEILRDMLETAAEKDPAGFLDKISDADGDNIALIKMAIQSGALVIDHEGHALRWPGENGGIFITVTQTDPDKVAREGAAYLRDAKEGAAIATNLKKEIDGNSASGKKVKAAGK